MATDLADWTQGVNVTGGSVSITGTATVSISGTPTVQFAAGQTVNIGNTPAVTISSGSVTIANASIAVINASGTKITSARPSTLLATIVNTPNPITTTVTLPADIQGLVITLPNALGDYVHLKISYTPNAGSPTNYVPLELFQFNQNVYAIPLLPEQRMQNQGLSNSIDVLFQGTVAGSKVVNVYAIFESTPLWMEVFPLPQLSPNQQPLNKLVPAQANLTASWLITPVANVQINLFELITDLVSGGALGGSYIVGHGTTLPVTSPATGVLFASQNTGAFTYPYHGVPLTRGDGIWIWNETTIALTTSHLINYSLS